MWRQACEAWAEGCARNADACSPPQLASLIFCPFEWPLTHPPLGMPKRATYIVYWNSYAVPKRARFQGPLTLSTPLLASCTPLLPCSHRRRSEGYQKWGKEPVIARKMTCDRVCAVPWSLQGSRASQPRGCRLKPKEVLAPALAAAPNVALWVP